MLVDHADILTAKGILMTMCKMDAKQEEYLDKLMEACYKVGYEEGKENEHESNTDWRDT